MAAFIFLAATVVAAMDGQGAIFYLIALPICAVLLAVAYRLSSARSFSRRLLLLEGLFLALFVLSALVPPLRFFPQAIVGGVSKSFQEITGLSPYSWNKQRNGPGAALNKTLREADAEITLEQFSVVPGWSRVCVFGPYSNEQDAAKALGYYSATLAQSRVSHSEGVAALVFVNEKGTLSVVDIDRTAVDFAALSRTCLTPQNFPLSIDKSTGGRIAKVRP